MKSLADSKDSLTTWEELGDETGNNDYFVLIWEKYVARSPLGDSCFGLLWDSDRFKSRIPHGQHLSSWDYDPELRVLATVTIQAMAKDSLPGFQQNLTDRSY